MNRDNMLHLDTMVDLAVSAGMDRVHFSVVLDFDQEGLKQYTLTPPEIEVVREQLEIIRPRLVRLKLDNNIDDVLLRYRIGRSVRKLVPCYGGWFYSFLDTRGQVKVCQRATGALGDLREQSFAQIWNGPAYRAFRRQSMQQQFYEGGDRRFDCSFCPHLANNHRVDRIYRLIEPLVRKDKSHHP
jgi:MoaA/NifB/PqqE/SkfB family radical SAM enzyme